MTMQEHFEKLTQEQESGATLTAEQADARKKLIAMEATTLVTAHLLVADLFMNVLKSIPENIKAEHAAYSKCLDIITQMKCGDVSAE